MESRQLSGWVERYNNAKKSGSIELEIRFNITGEMFKQIISSMSGGKLSHTTDIIQELPGKDQVKNIFTITYKNGESSGVSYMQKKRLTAPQHINGYVKYRISMASETPISKFNPPTNSLIRFKNRISWEFSPKWRLDMTAVRQQALNDGDNKRIKEEMFPKQQTPENYIDTIPESATTFECELEFIGTVLTEEDFSIVDKLFAKINNEYATEAKYQTIIASIAKHIYPIAQQGNFTQPSYRLKQLANQVIALNRNVYYQELWPPAGYYVTDKADGKRCMIYCGPEGYYIVLSDSLIELGSVNDKIDETITLIADAEMVDDTVYIFDVLYLVDNKSHEGIEHRINYIDTVCDTLRTNLSGTTKLLFEPKQYVKLDNTPENIRKSILEIWNAKRPYETDGLILSEPGQSYISTHNYKWKPLKNNTIDFLAIQCPQKLLGLAPYIVKPEHTLYLLFVGISQTMISKLGLSFIKHYRTIFPAMDGNYVPIQFSPSAQPYAYIYYSKDNTLDHKIIELVRKGTINLSVGENSIPLSEWELVRLRDDRKMEKNYFGNDYRIAEITYMNYIDPFNLEDLWKAPESYFRGQSDDIYVAKNKLMRFAISLLLRDNFAGFKTVVDLAAGRGADIHRLAEIGVQNAICVDIDAAALAELVRRKYSFIKQKKSWMKGGDDNFEKQNNNMTTHILVANLKEPFNKTLADIISLGVNESGVDGVMCNFAVHYMCDSRENIYNFLALVSKLLKTGGVLMLTTMNGEKVYNLLEENPVWESREGTTLKYSLVKKYQGKTFAKAGQNISVLLPFTSEMYDEPLCNVDTIITTARKCGLEVELNSSFTDYIERFGKTERSLYERLTVEDKKYIELHQYLTFRKVKNVKVT